MFRSASLDGASAGAGPQPRLSSGARGPLAYLAGLRAAQRVLWCYLIWYLAVLVRYFDGSPALWASSLGISAIIGTALFLSTTRTGRVRVKLERWQIARLYLMPFCVSSFAALIKGHGFVLVFHPRLRDNLLAAGACATFLGVTALVRRRLVEA
ncbi:MAG TPA: hypothetical protein VIU64_01375 [Polyangia bacterium]